MIDLSFSWDDGSIHDIKMAELYNNYDLSATFFIPTKNNELKILQKSDVKSMTYHFDDSIPNDVTMNLDKLEREL